MPHRIFTPPRTRRALLGAVLVALAPVAGATVIDRFDATEHSVSFFTTTQSTVAAAEAIGGQRTLRLPDPRLGDAAAVATGLFTFNPNTQSASSAQVVWDGNAPWGLDGDALVVRVLDPGNGFDGFSLALSLTSGGTTASVTRAVTAPGDEVFLFDAFSAVDFAAIDTLTLEVEAAALADVAIDWVQSRAVPEPTPALLLAAGLAGLAGARPRRRTTPLAPELTSGTAA